MKEFRSPIKAIRANCLQCAQSSIEVKRCPMTECPLFPFRFGKNPFRQRELTEEQKQATAARLKAGREAKKNEAERDADGDGHP